MDQKLSALTPLPAIDRANDLLYVVDVSGNTSNRATPNFMLGITGSPVGTTDVQTLTNKNITSPAISSPVLSGTITGTYTLGGTPTFPTSIVTLTGTQTLTNKTLTSPTINTPTISNATITANAISGFTTANSGTIYGVSIVLGIITGTNIMNGAAIQDGTITNTKLSTTAITLASVSSSTSQSGIVNTPVIVTGLTSTVTNPSGGRTLRVEGYIPSIQASSASIWTFYIYNSSTVTGSAIQSATITQSLAGVPMNGFVFWEGTLPAGSQSFCIAVKSDTGTASTILTTTQKSYLTVRLL